MKQSELMAKSAFVVAATSSGCGKTTFSLGLMRSLCRKGLKVHPFKCGPDYIDTQFHYVATGIPSINLDLFMSSEQHVRTLFHSSSATADVCVVEGVMGMFDGYDKMKGSSADVALVTGIPVVLLVDASSAAFSVGATILGFSRFCPDVRIAGVVFNRVASENHFRFLRAACDETGIECFGYIRRSPDLKTPSRHLGLTLGGIDAMKQFVENAADMVEYGVDIKRLLEATSFTSDIIFQNRKKYGQRKIAVAKDEAFNFIYPANIEAFNGDVSFFSPLHDKELPDADLVYLPGGYPELYAGQLEGNRNMRGSICAYVERGGKLLAECGGLLYLSESIDNHEMCGVFPLAATMENAKLTLGYRTVSLSGFTLKGHEFHYSKIINPEIVDSVAVQKNAKGEEVSTPLYRYKNTFAGYTHLYWGESDIYKLWKI